MTESDISLLLVDPHLTRDGTPLAFSALAVSGTTFTYTIQLESLGKRENGNYTCTATVRPKPTSTYLAVSGDSIQDAATLVIAVGELIEGLNFIE